MCGAHNKTPQHVFMFVSLPKHWYLQSISSCCPVICTILLVAPCTLPLHSKLSGKMLCLQFICMPFRLLLHAIKHRNMSLAARMLEKVWPQENRSQLLNEFSEIIIYRKILCCSLTQLSVENTKWLYLLDVSVFVWNKCIGLCSMFVYYLRNM